MRIQKFSNVEEEFYTYQVDIQKLSEKKHGVILADRPIRVRTVWTHMEARAYKTYKKL